MMYRYGVYLCFILTQVTVHSQSKIISLDVRDTTGGAMTPFWSYFGYDEPNYTYTHDGKKLLTQLQTLSYVPVHVRTHNLLTSRGNSSGPDLKWGYTDAYMEKTDGSAIYNWVTVDSIIDTYILSGMKPLMEIGFPVIPNRMIIPGQKAVTYGRDGPIRQKITKNGATWSMSGSGIPSTDMVSKK